VLRVLTWNLQGSRGLDVDAVTRVVDAAAPDVFLVQEVQRGQATRLARSTGLPHRRWAFKHWPVLSRPEGMAVLSRSRLTSSTAFVLWSSWPWSWKRRIAIEATVVVESRPVRFINVHLSPHAARDRRNEEIERVLGRRGVVPPVIAGDFNDRPGGSAVQRLIAAGWQDAWRAAHPEYPDDQGPEGPPDRPDDGATNWTAGDRGGRPPTQRIDFVFVPPAWRVEACDVVAAPLAELAATSDHLPLCTILGPA
jgi:endonuclease/exonuclease/phosphatase family metal-dependent hydrolase